MKLLLLLVVFACWRGGARDVIVENTRLPVDQHKNSIVTGEVTVLVGPKSTPYQGLYYVYFNNWGGCPGVDCCDSANGCASCCFSPPSSKYPDACVYTTNHTVVVYSTPDFAEWQYLGEALPLSARKVGIEFRPQVVYNPSSRTFVMWYEDRWSGQDGYSVAISSTPQGPFKTVSNTVKVSGPGRVGDYDIFIDDDGTGYHFRTGLVIQKLTSDYMGFTGEYTYLSNPNVEGPSMFKRNGVYYLLAGLGCCACKGGSNIEVYTGSSPMGPYKYQSDVGSNTTHPFDKHSPYNYVTRAQQSKIFPVEAADGSVQWVWLGNQWVTSSEVGHPRNNDLLYFDILKFNNTGAVMQFTWKPSIVLSVQ